MQILPQQPSSIAKNLDASFKLFAASFSKLIGFGLMITALYIASTFMSAYILAGSPVGADAAAVQALALQRLPVLAGYILILTLFSLICYTGIIYRVDNLVQQREDSFGAALFASLKKFPTMVLALILYGLAVGFGSLLLVVPGIALMFSLSFYLYFVVIEGLGAYGSLKASHKLVWGHWWRTLSVYMVPGVLMLIFYVVLGFISYPLSGGANQPGSISIGNILSNLLSGMIMPYFYVLGYVLYHDLKLRKSGGDLAARLAQ